MKKFLFGALLSVFGFLITAFCLVYAAMNPWSYNGVTGLIGSLLGTGTLFTFIISLALFIAGLIICWYEAYRRK
jgi:hypothetical protein